ncbi:YunC family protein [Methanogenium organophilum]|uniref:YunC family protein n=1 Tax=Methanogenium organophilum TaxID=2199 RepID=A0A9X9S6Y2_METOG|nr:YunC family protein [Methanogenium organophilum]WAI02535.1 YunC family protein [Methanogenium organophilum]
MTDEKITIGGEEFVCSIIPAGPVNIVFAANDSGLVGCGAIDVTALAGFGYAAARIRPPDGHTSVATADDLMRGIIKEANPIAEEKGVRVGMTGEEALALLG